MILSSTDYAQINQALFFIQNVMETNKELCLFCIQKLDLVNRVMSLLVTAFERPTVNIAMIETLVGIMLCISRRSPSKISGHKYASKIIAMAVSIIMFSQTQNEVAIPDLLDELVEILSRLSESE